MIEAGTRSAAPHGPASVHELLQFERLMSELSASFINLPAAQIDDVIESGLRRIVETLDIDRSSLTRLSPDTGQLHTTHSWAAEGLPPVSTTPWAREAFSWLIAMGRAGKPLVFSRLDDLPPAASADKRSYQSIGMRSHVAQPLMVAGELVGFLGFGCLGRECAWPEDLVARMRGLADVFASALARRRSQEELDQAVGFERLATSILASLLIAGPGDEDRAIELGLRDVALFLGVERAALWQRLPGQGGFRRTHRWLAEDALFPADPGGVLAIPGISARLVAGAVVRFARLAELPAEAADLPALQELGVRSLLAVPFSVSGEVAGALAVGSAREEREWPEVLIPGVRLLAEVFASLDARRSAERQKRAAEAEAAQFRERLAHLVRVHTVGEMSAALAHEISQPLVAIENYALAARRRGAEASPDPAKVTELLDKVIAQTARAGDVVKRFRSMVKRHDTEAKAIDVEHAVRQCVQMVKTDCELRDIDLELKLAGELPAVVADEIQVQQVILNLLRNAIDAMEAMGPDAPKVITIQTSFSVEGGVSVRVADRGPGIAEGDLDRVFEPFYSTKATGLGIGLAICRKLIEAHGGALRALRNPAGGAVFQFTLPVPGLGD